MHTAVLFVLLPLIPLFREKFINHPLSLKPLLLKVYFTTRLQQTADSICDTKSTVYPCARRSEPAN